MAEANTPEAEGLPREPDDATAAAIKYWGKRIEAAEERNRDFRATCERNRKYVRGTAHDDGAPGLVRTNLTHSTIATLTPHIYAKDPDVVVSPVEHVTPSNYGAVKRFARTSELVLKRKFITEGKVKKRLKSNIRSIFTTGVGWLKMTYSSDIVFDPITANRINTLQDNLREIDVLQARLKNPGDIEKTNLSKYELLRQLEAVKNESEPRHWKGIVLDRVLSEDIMILDLGVTDFEDYVHADAIAHGIWMNEEQYEATFGYKPKGSTYTPETMPAALKQDADKTQVNYKRVWEIWSLKHHCVFTYCAGETRWARPPYTPQHLPHRFYPFYCGAFFPADGEWRPMDLVSLMKELQDEYNKTRTTYAEHREDSIPVRVVRQGGTLTPEDIERIQNRKPREIIVVSGSGRTDPIGNDLGELRNIPLQPEMYDVTQIRADMDLVSGTPDASRGQLTEAKTATEAAILQEGMTSRSGDMRDNTEDLLSEMLCDALQIMLQCMSVEDVVEIAGPGAVWPTLARDQVFGLVQVSVRGGSTARPNKMQEKEQWIEILPVLREFMTTTHEVMASGNTQIASTMVHLLKETLQRFDERLDIQSIMPFASEDGEGVDQEQMGAMAQAQQLQAQMQEMQQYVQQLEQQLAQAQAAIEDKSIEAEREAQKAEADRAFQMEKLDREDAARREKEAAQLDIEAEREQRREIGEMLSRIEVALTQSAQQKQQQAAEGVAQSATKVNEDRMVETLRTMQQVLVNMRKGRARVRRREDGTPEAIETEDGAVMPIETDERGLVSAVG